MKKLSKMKSTFKMRILLLIGLFLSQFSYAQKLELEFGKISDKELNMKSYEKDKKAKAVILYDKGDAIFVDTDNGYDIRFTRHKRIKIFDKSEAQHSEISIPYFVDGYGKTEIVKSIKAFTYNKVDGKLIRKRLDPATVYEERINERWHNKKFVFPDVQDGSVLEYQYVLETPFHFNLPDWVFQDKIPTIYSEYQVSMIPFYEYVFIAQGITHFDYQKSVLATKIRSWGVITESHGQNIGSGFEFRDNVHTYILKHIPAFKDESYISSINDYIVKMDFQLAKFHSPRGGTSNIISTWPALNKSLLKEEKFGKYLKRSSRIAKKIVSQELNLTDKNNTQKVKTIIEYVKSNFEWNGYFGKYASQTPKQFFKQKTGNAADINLFMISLLNEAEINTTPLLISTKGHGRIQTIYPFGHFTNYVIALINLDTPLLADGTEELLPYNRIPIRCKNEKGLIVEKSDTPRWITLESRISSVENTRILMKLDTVSMNIEAQIYIQKTEYNSFKSRKRFGNDTMKIRKFYAGRVGDIISSQTTDYKKTSYPYTIKFKTIYETEKLFNNIVIKPFIYLPISKNKLTQQSRTYPVDFTYPWEKKYETTLEIPSGFKIVELPKGFNIKNKLAEVNLDYSLHGDILTVKGNYKFKQSLYVSDEYARIKYYLDQVIKNFNRAIVLVKKN